MGPIIPSGPIKAAKLLKDKPHRFMWYQDTINLFDTMVYGPFDFIDSHLVPAEAWDTLLAKGKDMEVYINNVNRIIPLDQPDRQDRNITEDTTSCFITSCWPLDPTFND
jgi:hypothetical protein